MEIRKQGTPSKAPTRGQPNQKAKRGKQRQPSTGWDQDRQTSDLSSDCHYVCYVLWLKSSPETLNYFWALFLYSYNKNKTKQNKAFFKVCPDESGFILLTSLTLSVSQLVCGRWPPQRQPFNWFLTASIMTNGSIQWPSCPVITPVKIFTTFTA